MTTKQTVETLVQQLAAVQAELAALKAKPQAQTQVKSSGISEAAALRLSAKHWTDIRFNMVVGGAAKPQLSKTHKGYKLVKGADRKVYMAVKGFAATLKAQSDKGEPVGLHTEINDKGRSQAMYAAETLDALVKAGFVNPNAEILSDGETAKRGVGRPKGSRNRK